MFVHVCRNCWAVHTEDWFAYKWVKKFQRDTRTYVLKKREKREEKVDEVECRACRKHLFRQSIPTAIEGTYEVLETCSKTISEDEYGQLYFLGYDTAEHTLPLTAIPISRRTANEIVKKMNDGNVILKFVAGRETILVFGAGTERKSHNLFKEQMDAGLEKAPKKLEEEDRKGILAFT